MNGNDNPRETTVSERINELIKQFFSDIQERITMVIISKIKTFLVYPIEEKLLSWLLDGFLDLTTQQYETIFNFDEEALRNQLTKMKEQHEVCEMNYLKFQSMVKEIDSSSEGDIKIKMKEL